MATRSIGSGSITFGLVMIPFKLYTATSPKTVGFNMLHKTCGSRVNQKLFCATEKIEIERSDTAKGFEFSKDQYVRFSDEEIKDMEAERSGVLAIEEFVPAASVDDLYIQKTYFLGPDKGGARAYKLLAETLQRNGVVGIGRFAQRGKDDLTIVRPYKDGLVLHESFYADEVRSFAEVETGGAFDFHPAENELADTLVRQLRQEAFDPSRFHDTWAAKVMAAVQQKIAGQEIASTPLVPKPMVIDLLEALARSVAANEHRVEEATVKRDELLAEAPPGPKGLKKAEPRATEEAAPETVAATSTVQSKGPKKARERKQPSETKKKSG